MEMMKKDMNEITRTAPFRTATCSRITCKKKDLKMFKNGFKLCHGGYQNTSKSPVRDLKRITTRKVGIETVSRPTTCFWLTCGKGGFKTVSRPGYVVPNQYHGLTRREDARFWDRLRVVYHQVSLSIRKLKRFHGLNKYLSNSITVGKRHFKAVSGPGNVPF